MNNDLPEAHAVAFTNFKRTDGFEVSITLRGDNGTEVLERLGKAIDQIKADGGTPITRNFSKFPPRADVPTKPCPTHPEADMKQNKNGNWYHSRGVYPDMEYCNGKGFPQKIIERQVEDY